MSISKSIFAFSLVFLFQVNIFQAQIKKGELQKGELVTAEISKDEKHQYVLKLKADQYAFIKLLQKGIDLKITTYNPKQEKLNDFDSPNGKYGPELFSITSNKKGKYIIEVTSLNEEQSAGCYELSIQTLKAKAVTNEEQIAEIFAAYDSPDSPGASIAVVKDGDIIYKNGFGMANLEYDIPNTPSTVFHVASVSKQFTVMAILLLEKDGKISLDDDIRKYIPEVPDFGETITLRHLASHTSGLRDQWNLLAMAGWRLDDVITKEHVLKLVSKQKELNFKVGSKFTYCNTGFTLLAEVVARVSEQSFAEFTKAHIFKPLKMNHTLFYDDHEKIVKNRAYSYSTYGNGYKKNILSYANVGATSLFTTAEDLSLWAMNFSNPKVGDTSIIKKMNTKATLNNGKEFGGALGQFVGKYKGLNEIQHGGADAGYRTFLTRFPDENLSVVVLGNSAQFRSGNMAHKVADVYLKDKIKKEPKKEKVEVKEASADVVVTAETLKTYIGDFELQPGFIISITEENGALFGMATGQPKVALIPISITEFNVTGVEAKIEFIPNEGENIKLLKLHQGGRIMDAPRTKAFDKDAVNLAEFTGSYYSDELQTTYNLIIEEDHLVATHQRHSNLKVVPIKKDLFSGEAWFIGQIKFERDADNKIIGCKVSNGRVQNLHFNKVK